MGVGEIRPPGDDRHLQRTGWWSMVPEYRTGAHWGVTVIEIGTAPEDESGRRADDRLVACAQSARDAALIVDALNAYRDAVCVR